MLGSEWLYGAIALLVGIHVLTMLYAYRRQGEPTSGPTQPESERTMPASNDDDEDGTVSCAQCGAANKRGYQFCRECVADLSSGSPQRHSREQPRAY